jgi:hypothetical protein
MPRRRFRNMLVLCITYLDHHLQHLVDRRSLFDMLASTIDFLEELAPVSATFRYGCSTLKNIRLAVLRSSGWYSAGLVMAPTTRLFHSGCWQPLSVSKATTSWLSVSSDTETTSD